MEDKILNLLKTYKRKIVKYGIIIFILCLFTVQLPYWIGDIKTIIQTDFSASDVLGFLGNFLASFGTIVLGYVTMKQTEEANAISDRLLQLEERKYNAEHEPTVVVDWVKLHNSSYHSVANNIKFPGRLYYVDSPKYNPNDRDGYWEIRIINTGITGLYNCDIMRISSDPEELQYCEIDPIPFNLKAGECIDLALYLNSDIVERYAQRKIKAVSIVLKCINNFGEKYLITLVVSGNCVLFGNRYEEMLIPNVHPIKWKVKSELVEDNIGENIRELWSN